MEKNWLQVSTRDGADARGKPKIYISYCENALNGGFLSSLKFEILEYQDCAVYYGFGEADETDRSKVIAAMNIMVALISKDATNKESVVYREIETAKRFQVPVFPIVVESISPDDINATFGNLQYLYRETVYKSGSGFSEKVATVTYKEKLKEHLQYILVDKELHERIKKEFAGKVFLSYRKKDYRWVSNIGGIIVNDERFRDTAVWYDDYLIYGERFDKSIEYALSESDVFLLAITKNMVNEDNYVTSVEYPMAKRLNKRILGMVLEDVDQDKIAEKFPGLDDLINIDDYKHIYEKLIKFLKGYDNRKLNNSPEHMYLIGLAHYYGINVPKRNNEGFSIIKQAAERGSVDALKMVSRILRFGFDKSEAVKWQEKTVDIIEKLHYNNKELLFEEKLRLSEIYRENNAEAELTKSLKEFIVRFKGQLIEKGIYESSLLELGELLINAGDFEESKKHLIAAIKLYKGNKTKTYEVAEAYRLLANILVDEHEFSRAEKLLTNAFSIVKEIDDEAVSVEQIKISATFEKLDRAAQKAGVFIKSRRGFISTFGFERTAMKTMKGSEKCRVYKLFGEIEYSGEMAAGYFSKALSNLSEYDFLNKDVYNEKKSELCVLIAEAYEKAKKYTEAERYYQCALDCYIIEGENAIRYCDGYVNCKNKLARLYYKMKYYSKADENFEFPVKNYSGILLNRPKAYVLEEIKIYVIKGCCHEAREDYFRAEEIYRLAAKTIREAMEKFSPSGFNELLAEVYARLGTIYGEREDCDNYHTYFKRAIKLYKKGKYIYLDEGESVYRHYADALAKDSKYLRAWYYYRKAMKRNMIYSQKMIRNTVVYSKLSRMFVDMKLLSVAERLLEKAEELWEAFVESDKKERRPKRFWLEAPPTYYRVGVLEQSPADELKYAKEYIDKALKEKNGKR